MNNQKCSYNAKFSGPRGELNPMGLKVPGWVSVQLFPETVDRWRIQNPDTKGVLTAKKFISPDQAMAFLPEIFEKQETQWDILDMYGNAVIPKEATS